MKIGKSLKKLKGDASLRTFFRNKKKNSSSIIVYSNKNKRSNLLIYDSINQILLKTIAYQLILFKITKFGLNKVF